MNDLKIDIRKLRTPENYGKEFGISKPTVYKRIKEGELKTIRIDGRLYVVID